MQAKQSAKNCRFIIIVTVFEQFDKPPVFLETYRLNLTLLFDLHTLPTVCPTKIVRALTR